MTSAFSQIDTALFTGMKARSIGPAGMSGRIADIQAVASNPNVIYAGVSIGGVWRSRNGGTTWQPIFDDQPVAAVGSIGLFQANPSIIWVGTGEGNPRNSASVGNGVYKSLDGGDTWTHVGLEKTERIHRLILHPGDPNVAYAAAMGQMWGENPDRGVFKTTDGGKNWKKMLFVDERTGCADLVIDPSNPNKLFAAMWEYRRWPWFFKSGGPGSGLYVTHDGGETWKKLTDKDGLPKSELGRIGVAIARNNPEVVYALVEAKKNALLRSEDGGKSWRTVNETPNVNPRPFYYCDIRVDPQNENRVYSLNSNLQVSNDGGRTFTSLGARGVHSDHHALWIHPNDGSFLLDGNDGGVYISHDYGSSWRFVDNIPAGQFYHISVDMEIPYNIYGGMQDNGSWRGPSDLWENGGIRNWHWNEIGFGDGFASVVDASNPENGYAMSQGGALIRFNWKTGERKSIRPPGPDGVTLRFNWNAGIAQDPFDPNTIYYGSQFVHKSTNRGDDWSIISQDLTTSDATKQNQQESGGLTKDVTAAENHCTILTIAPSTVQRDVVWVGTDDGNVQVTQDGGKTWTNVVGKVPEVPRNTWVPHIEASKFDAGTAYVAFDDHRRSNWKTYVFKTTDFGKSWTSLTKSDPTAGSKEKHELWGYALVIEQDPVKKDLLYLGTEFGLWISLDDGKNWMKWTNGLPTASTMALTVHPRDHDLVVATHGRSAFILDDVRPLRTLSKDLLEKPVAIFETPPSYQHPVRAMDGYHFPADAMFRGDTKQYGALLTYSINVPPESLRTPTMPGMPDVAGGGGESESARETQAQVPEFVAAMFGGGPAGSGGGRRDTLRVRIEISDATGKLIRRMDGPAKKGINRATWNLRMDGPRMPRLGGTQRSEGGGGFSGGQGSEVLPGKYTVRVRAGRHEASGTVEVLTDPRSKVLMADRQQNFELRQKLAQRMEVAAEAVDRITRTKRTIDAMMEQARSRPFPGMMEFRKLADSVKKKLTDVQDMFIEEPNRIQGLTRNPNTVASKLMGASQGLASSWDAPSSMNQTNLRQTETVLDAALKEFNKVFSEDVAVFKQKVEAAKLQLFQQHDPLNLDWKPRRRE